MAPTMLTSRPSRTQVMPSETTTIQCQRVQGSRSSRAGMLVSTTSFRTDCCCRGDAGETTCLRALFMAYTHPFSLEIVLWKFLLFVTRVSFDGNQLRLGALGTGDAQAQNAVPIGSTSG